MDLEFRITLMSRNFDIVDADEFQQGDYPHRRLSYASRRFWRNMVHHRRVATRRW
jgi:hypothetical protein